MSVAKTNPIHSAPLRRANRRTTAQHFICKQKPHPVWFLRRAQSVPTQCKHILYPSWLRLIMGQLTWSYRSSTYRVYWPKVINCMRSLRLLCRGIGTRFFEAHAVEHIQPQGSYPTQENTVRIYPTLGSSRLDSAVRGNTLTVSVTHVPFKAMLHEVIFAAT